MFIVRRISFGSACGRNDGSVHGYRVGVKANGRVAVQRLTRQVMRAMNCRNGLAFSDDGPSNAVHGLASPSGLRTLN